MFEKMMEITTYLGCPLECKYCPQKLLKKSYKGGNIRTRMMSYETFVACVDKIPVDVDIHFSGMCEPWTNHACSSMVKYAAEKGHKIYIFTTMVGMKKSDYQMLKEVNVESIILHIPDEDNNSKFPQDVKYYKLLREALMDIKDGIFKVDAFSCHGPVKAEIRQMVRETGIKIMRSINDRAGNLESEGSNISHQFYESGSIICRFCNGDRLDKNVLMPDGSVYLCCMDYGLEYPLGNLLDGNFIDVSEGKMKQTYRERLKNADKGMILCRKCSRAILRDMQ